MYFTAVFDVLGFIHAEHSAFFHYPHTCRVFLKRPCRDLGKALGKEKFDHCAYRLGGVAFIIKIGVERPAKLKPLSVGGYFGIV